jgi:hypothetical protein
MIVASPHEAYVVRRQLASWAFCANASIFQKIRNRGFLRGCEEFLESAARDA